MDLNCPAVLHGRTYEDVAIESFSKVTGFHVKKCGLFISDSHPFLAASPDGLVGEDSLVEVKCPFSGKDEPIMPGPQFPFLHTNMSLKHEHNFYMQIQGQLFVTKRKVCYFVIFTFHKENGLHFQQVPYDETFCEEELIPKLEKFYEEDFQRFASNFLCSNCLWLLFRQ